MTKQEVDAHWERTDSMMEMHLQRNLHQVDHNRKFSSSLKTVVSVLYGLATVSVMSGCVPTSGEIEVAELIYVNAPTFTGATQRFFTTPSQVHALTGECDMNSRSLEYSTDRETWIEIPNGCVNGTFSVVVKMKTGKATYYVRAMGKLTYTEIATAVVQFVLPSTATLMTMVTSAHSDSSDQAGRGTQNAMGETFTGYPMTGNTTKVDSYLPGMVYAE